MGAGVPGSDPVGPVGSVDVRLLGHAHVQVDGTTLDVLRSGRARALLGRLAIHPHEPQSRRSIAFEFWPDSTETQALTNLRNLLHTLRRSHPSIDASIEVTDSTLRWCPSPVASVDVNSFRASADEAEATDPDAVDDVVALCRRAIDCYSGELLAGDDEEWLTGPRGELRDRYRRVLRLLASALIDGGRASEATSAARRLVETDPLDESAHRLHIEALAAAGDRAGAVRAYHECVAVLDRELGVGPADATRLLHAELLESASPPGTSTGPAIRARSDLVGRDREWAALVEAWDRAASGSASMVVLTGEPGIGKSRLVDELRTHCLDTGAAVAWTRSYASEGELGFGVIASWLRSRDLTDARSRLDVGQVRSLARLLPELGDPTVEEDVDDAERRRRLFDAAVAGLTVARRTTLLVADDAQWSDQASLELIHYLVRQDLDTPVLVVLTARSEDLDPTNAISALQRSLALLDRSTEVVLPRLEATDTAELAARLTGSALDADAVDALFAESEGNPLFVVEAVRSGWDGSGRVALSPRLRAVIDDRLRRLSDEAREVVGAAAVVGRPCAPSLLRTLSGLDDRGMVTALDELWRRGILSESGGDSYDFSHGKLREATYDGLSPARRRDVHGQVASLLAAAAEAGETVSGNEIATHSEAAGRPLDAVVWLRRAAADAHQRFAHDDATRLLDRALALVPSLPPDRRHSTELELLSDMPLPLAVLGGYGTDRMSETHRRATDVAALLGVELDPAFVRTMVMTSVCQDRFDDARAAAERLHAHAVAAGDDSLRVESRYLMGIAAFWASLLDDARVHFEAVVDEFDDDSREHHHVRFGHDPQVVCLSRLANTLWFLGDRAGAVATCDAALQLAQDVAHPLSHDTATIFASVLAVDLEDHDRLRRVVDQGVELGVHSVPFEVKRSALDGLLATVAGRPSGPAQVRAALDRCDGHNFYPGFQATLLRLLVAAHDVAGDPEGGLVACARALALGSTPLWDAEFHRLRADFLHRSGAPESEVADALEDARRSVRHLGTRGHEDRIVETAKRLAKRS